MLQPERRSHPSDLRTALHVYEWAVAFVTITWIVSAIADDPAPFLDPELLMWVIAIAIVDLLPVPTTSSLEFSLSFPLQLAVALIYAPHVAAVIVFLGTSDPRELRLRMPLAKSLFIRAQMALCVAGESFLFHSLATLESEWYILAPAVLLAALAGYAINTAFVALYFRIESGIPMRQIVREMHVGVLGEFVIAYMGLALFSVLAAAEFVQVGFWTIVVFLAPLAFARQMFLRTHSLEVATGELAEREKEKEYQALHDSLTDLPNRTLFMRHLRENLEALQPGEHLAVVILDLDGFKEINDTLGHHVGDLLLKKVGPQLTSALREGDLIARLGGDEFGAVLLGVVEEDAALRVARRFVRKLELPIDVEGLALNVTGSVGMALCPNHGTDAEALLSKADVAMYAAKSAGTGIELYQPVMDEDNPSRLALATRVRPAIEHEEFLLHYQPKCTMSDGSVVGVEALVRWNHPDRGLVMPDEFVPLVERTTLLGPFTEHVISQAFRQWHTWHRRGIATSIAVNLSPRSLVDTQLPRTVETLIERWEVPPSAVTMELTEHVMLTDSTRSLAVLKSLSDVGVQLSIDDFGTGYSSLGYLRLLPIDEIKVDRSFISRMRRDPNDAAIVKSTLDLGRNLGLRTVAEGVEDRETWEILRSMGCDLAQGFLVSRPLDSDAVIPWLVIPEPPHSTRRVVERIGASAAFAPEPAKAS